MNLTEAWPAICGGRPHFLPDSTDTILVGLRSGIVGVFAKKAGKMTHLGGMELVASSSAAGEWVPATGLPPIDAVLGCVRAPALAGVYRVVRDTTVPAPAPQHASTPVPISAPTPAAVEDEEEEEVESDFYPVDEEVDED